MWGLAVAVALAVAPAQVKLAAPGLNGANVTRELATFFSDHLAQQLALRGVAVMTTTEMSSLLGLERQKQLLGCSNEETAACMAELASALGVDGVVTGTIGKLDGVFHLDVKIVSSANASTLALYSGEAASEREALGALVEAAVSLKEQLVEKLQLAREPNVATATSSGGARRYWWAPAAVGVVGLVVGGIMMGLVAGHVNTLRTARAADLDYAAAMNELSTGNTQQAIGITALTVGGLALAVAAVMALFGGSSP